MNRSKSLPWLGTWERAVGLGEGDRPPTNLPPRVPCCPPGCCPLGAYAQVAEE